MDDEQFEVEMLDVDMRGNEMDVSVEDPTSPVLVRLIEEVRNEREMSVNAYNRMHNRHNRSR